MGDRGNIAIHTGEGDRVYLYSHWSGHDMPEILRGALARASDRWDDPQYLARVVFCDLIGGDTKSTTGFGISATLGDNEHPIIVVDCERQVVRLEDDPSKSYARADSPKSWAIADFAALKEATWGDLDEARKEEAA